MAELAESALGAWLAAHLVRLGPGLLFAICLLETAVFAGMILPVGAMIAFSALLSARGVFDPSDVVFVTLLGALCGDQLGFLMGRWFVFGASRPRGRVGQLWGSTMHRTEKLLTGRGALGISLARVIPFVRTVMPWFVGRLHVPWGRFVVFDSLGIVLWAVLYLGGGFLAGQGWRQAAERFGEGAGAVVLVAVAGVFVWLSKPLIRALRRRRRRA